MDQTARRPGAGDAGADTIVRAMGGSQGDLYRATGADARRPGRAAEARIIADALLAASDRLRRLSPSHRDPEAYHVERSELEHELRSLAVAVERIGGRP